jgi:diguanylate cyclase (GGDEF)-like protein
LKTSITRTFAALNATNEAILYAKSPEELYEKVCEAAFSSGDFLATAVFLLEPGTNLLRFAAGFGEDIARLRSVDISIAADTPEGSGVCGQAFRDQQVCISNDYLNDARSLAWRQGAAASQVGAAAGLPLTCNGRSVGVFLVTRREPGSIDGPIVALLERMSANLSFALDNFDHEASRKNGERAMRRLTRMFAALSATNEAIMRARSRTEMFELVCQAAAQGGQFNSTSILLVRPDSDYFEMVAAAGPTADNASRLKVSTSEAVAVGRGVCGTAFRSAQACVNNDFLENPQNGAFVQVIQSDGARSGAAFPLSIDGRPVGVMLFISADTNTFTAEFAELLQRLADNVSFALGSFDRADEKAKTEEQKQRLTRMFAALGATNEAIMRAKSRTELFELVCDAATVGGNFTSTSIVLERPGADFLENVASAGPDRERASVVKLSADAARPEGQGITGIAFRTRQPCISNDYLTDFGSAGHFYQVVRDSGTRSGAALPLLKNGKAVGVIVFLSSELGAFSPELIGLLQRLAENIAFALENFDRADEKAKTEQQKESLTRMLAALSATNEAIVRARSRSELFDLVCEAAATGGRFTCTTVALAIRGSDQMEIVAGAGPTGASARQVTLSTNEADPAGRGVCGIAFRSGRACISNDYLADPRAAVFHAKARKDGSGSAAGFPLFVRGQVVGVMLYVAAEKDTFTPEFAELLQRLADNVSFALENFERADEKAKTEEQKERLTRMLAALSATNEAIVRATSRNELFELVCEAAAKGGKFTSTSIGLVRTDSDYLDFVAAAGPTADSARKVRASVNEAHPEGRGLSGTAIRSRQACIINDYLADARGPAFHAIARSDRTQSGAGFPLFARGQVVGVIIFISPEKHTFTPEFSELLQRLTDNVSFALENFDRADEKTRADERIEYLASHDSLTNLPNREMFNGLLRRAIDAAKRYRRQFAVLFIDLDRFKVINDSLGHDAGDMLLVETGGRLRRALRSSDVVARLGGDEFVVILEEAAERHEVERIAGELLSVLSQPMQLSGHECHTTASIGIAMYPSDGSDMLTLTKNADMAMYLAKEDGKNGFRFFTKEIKAQSIERLTLESALRRALERDQFSLHYQPKVDMASGQITGVEALLRWNHPELGLVSPGQFIPLAEETGLIVPIGRWVLTEACAQNMAWQRRGLRPVTMAVNLSPRQFADAHLLHDVDEALLASGMSPVLLQLEVTESMVMRNVSRAIKVLDAIQNRGIRLAIDDFGTGYSSMSLMKQFPIDTIKIDRSFVRDLPNDSEDQAIAQAIISMGKALGMTVIAEGVETVEQETFLRNHACDEMQGFLFSKPLPPRQMADLLRTAPLHVSPPLQPEAADAESASSSRLKGAVV